MDSDKVVRLASFDVGIKNLAYCVISIHPRDKSWSIDSWKCANLLELDLAPATPFQCCHTIAGKKKTDPSKPCGKKAKWKTPNDPHLYLCETHAKIHTEFIIPKREHSTSHINKLKLDDLKTVYSSIGFSVCASDEKWKKSDFISNLTRYYESKCFVNATTQLPSQKAGETDLVSIGRSIRKCLDSDAQVVDTGITHAIIENQISTIASRMKTIQGMIAQYFIMRFGNDIDVEFVSSHNKLKGFNREPTASVGAKDQKKTYKANKNDGVDICRLFFEANPDSMRGWVEMFEKSKKKDDLADCFLQGIWYLKSNKIISYAEDLKINIVVLS